MALDTLKKTAARLDLTAGRIDALTLPEGKQQAFSWDADTKNLGVRVTKGAKSFVFRGEWQGRTIRLTIGAVGDWRIPDARRKARELQQEIDEGHDPRKLKADNVALSVAHHEKAKTEAATVAEAWGRYLEERRPHWSARHYQDHVRIAREGGKARQRRDVKTTAGPLAPLMTLRLVDITPEFMEAWATREAKNRPGQARLAWRLLKAFVRWAAAERDYAAVTHPASLTKKAREKLGADGVRDDALLREQLPAWFAAVSGIDNPVIAAYLQILLLTGARREELMGIQWKDINERWRSITIRDKAESSGGKDGTRTIPLTPYVAFLVANLPRRNRWVFSSATSKNGQLREPSITHRDACRVAGLEGLTLHGLRRSYGSLSEWLELPAGVVAQLMGHKPSATAEKHYRVRPLDLLRLHAERFEGWILDSAGVTHEPQGEKLRLVAGGGK